MGFHSVLPVPVTTTTINESAPNRNLDTVQDATPSHRSAPGVTQASPFTLYYRFWLFSLLCPSTYVLLTFPRSWD